VGRHRDPALLSPADLAKVTDIPARATHGGARGHDTRDGARGTYDRDSPALGAC
jgi:hypothetical protein